MEFEISEKVPISIYRTGEPNFDRACEAAYKQALHIFGCDDMGHITRVKKADRSKHALNVKFKGFTYRGGMGGQEMHYQFEAWVD